MPISQCNLFKCVRLDRTERSKQGTIFSFLIRKKFLKMRIQPEISTFYAGLDLFGWRSHYISNSQAVYFLTKFYRHNIKVINTPSQSCNYNFTLSYTDLVTFTIK